MAESILINFTPQETRVAILEQGIVQELHVERHSTRGLVGNIYLGRIVRILPGMQSAFVDIGLERTAFLHVADILQARIGDVANRESRPIEEVISEGQTLLVQVIKDPIGTKGARLSTQVSIAGRMLVYLPQEKHIGISQRIDEAEREALRERLTRLVPADEAGGFILRTIAETADEASLQDDINYLRKLWTALKQQLTTSPVPCLMYQDLSLAQRVLRDFANPETERILVDSRETFQKLNEFAAVYVPGITGLLEHYNEDRRAQERYRIQTQ
jgi:ribonuclease G